MSGFGLCRVRLVGSVDSAEKSFRSRSRLTLVTVPVSIEGSKWGVAGCAKGELVDRRL